MKYLCVGSGPIKENLFEDNFDKAIFINAGIEHFYKVNAKEKIWITKPTFFIYRDYQEKSFNYEVRSKKKEILRKFINEKLMESLTLIILLTRKNNLLNKLNISEFNKNKKLKIINYWQIELILIQHLGIFYWLKLMSYKPLNILKLLVPQNISRIIRGYGPPRFWKASTGSLSFLIMNKLEWKNNPKYKIFTQGITNPLEGSEENVSRKARIYFLNSQKCELQSNHIHEHIYMDKLCISSLKSLNILW